MARMLTHHERQQMALSLFRKAAEAAQDGSHTLYPPPGDGDPTHRAIRKDAYKLLQDALQFVRTWGL